MPPSSRVVQSPFQRPRVHRPPSGWPPQEGNATGGAPDFDERELYEGNTVESGGESTIGDPNGGLPF
jgi:hypothetical protein